MAPRKKILVTGAKGMLGTDLVARLKTTRKYDLIAVDVEEMDITSLPQVKATFLEHRPNVVIHCGAYTNVDRAESERELAMAINSEGTKHIAFFCRELGAEMLYIGTDYIFDGTKQTPYIETDRPNPINVYGASKLAGEEHVATLLEKYKICRTSWLCGVHARNFVHTIVQAVSEGRPLSVVNDQVGRPTFTFDLADAIVWLLEKPEYGIFHVTNSGFCSWYEFAQRIVQLTGAKGISLRPITSEQFRSLARRPHFSVLENRHLEHLGFKPLPRWEDSLKEFFARKAALEQSAVPPVVARRGTPK